MTSMRSGHHWFLLISVLAVNACLVGVPKVFASSVAGADYSSPRPVPQPRSIAQQIKLANDYLSGHGVAQDMKMAAYWYLKAAEAGDSHAQILTGYFYDAGVGVVKDPALAVHWYQLAVANGNVRAKVNLGIMYLWGTGIPKDQQMAMRLFHEAADKGDGLAACYLGDVYRLGLGVSQDRSAAERWYERGAKARDPLAEYNLASLFMADADHPRDPRKTATLLRDSASMGYVPAMHLLGLLITRDPGMAKSPDEATTLLQASAAAGIWQSSVVLGIYARDGKDASHDPSAAYYHFRVADLQGGSDAQTFIANDLVKLASLLGPEKTRALDSQAQQWYSRHRLVLEFVKKEADNQTGYPAYALALPQNGAHVLQLIPPLAN